MKNSNGWCGRTRPIACLLLLSVFSDAQEELEYAPDPEEDSLESVALGFYPILPGYGGRENPKANPIQFAVIGDFGTGDDSSWRVADMVRSWEPEFVVTTGDNWYHSPDWETLDSRLCSPWHEWMTEEQCGGYPHKDGEQPLFIPSMGNHDWFSPDPYFGVFGSLPNLGRYYDVRKGPVHFFILGSDESEYDGTTMGSQQYNWFVQAASDSDAPYKIVVFHHPAFCTVTERVNYNMRWPFHELGITAVLNGHMHGYERLMKDDLVYMVNGAGGCCPKGFDGYDVEEHSQVIHGYDRAGEYVFGAQMVSVQNKLMDFSFWSVDGCLVDSVSIPPQHKRISWRTAELIEARNSIKYTDYPTPEEWVIYSFDDGSWESAGNDISAEHGRKARIFFRSLPVDFPYLKLRVLRGHGVSVWINGNPVLRLNVHPEDTSDKPYACTDHMSGWLETWVDGDVLSPSGNNVLSVQVHNRYDGSYGQLSVQLTGLYV